MPHAGLNLEVDNIEALQIDIERLEGKLLELREPEAGVPVRVATFLDCEGNGFELRQQPKDSLEYATIEWANRRQTGVR